MADSADDIRAADKNGVTALHTAAAHGPVRLVESLIRRGAVVWQGDANGKTPLDYARSGDAPDKDQIVELLDRPVIRDPVFRQGVRAIAAGDAAALTRLLREHPNLVHDRAVEPDCYPQDYFRDPKLLWFVANNLIWTEKLPPNIVEVAAAIIDAGAEQTDLDYTLGLVITGMKAREQGLQIPLIKLLVDRGAKPGDMVSALAHRELAAVEFLLAQGEPVTAPVAAALGRNDALRGLLAAASTAEKQTALALAVINQQVDAARLCLEAGADVNGFLPKGAHAHSTAAHQAAANDDVEMLRLLVGHGARLDARDKVWDGTPLGWAKHLGKAKAAAYLENAAKSQGAS